MVRTTVSSTTLCGLDFGRGVDIFENLTHRLYQVYLESTTINCSIFEFQFAKSFTWIRNGWVIKKALLWQVPDHSFGIIYHSLSLAHIYNKCLHVVKNQPGRRALWCLVACAKYFCVCDANCRARLEDEGEAGSACQKMQKTWREIEKGEDSR